MAEEKDDWLDDLDTPAEKEADLGQSDIDALLSGGDVQSPAAGAGDELDQSDINDLLSDGGGAGPTPSGVDELDQSDIDALLSGDTLTPAAAVEGAADGGELDQSDIDSLLSSPEAPAQAQPSVDPDQDEIDKLFTDLDDTSDAAESQPFPAEDIDFGDAFGAPDEAVSAPPQSSMPDIDAQDFKLEADFDIPDIPDPTVGLTPEQDLEEATTPIGAEAAPTGKEAESAAAAPVAPAGKFRPGRKALLAIGGGVAAVIVLAASFFIFRGGDKGVQEPAKEPAEAKLQEKSAAEPEVVHQAPEAPSEQPPAEAHPEPPPASVPATEQPEKPTAPTVAAEAPSLPDLSVVLPEGSNQVSITLDGKDPENDPLEYEFQVMPEHGQIAGHAPNLIYIPRADFTEHDSFTVRASDGKHVSRTATVSIDRPIAPKVLEAPLAQVVPEIPEIPVETAQEQAPAVVSPPPAETPAEAPSPASAPAAAPASPPPQVPAAEEAIAASNAAYRISNSLVIPWGRIWGKANDKPYGQDVLVEILQPPSHGTLRTAKGSPSVYTPDTAFSGQDVIRYRFVRGESKSEPKTIAIAVKHKNKAPELRIGPYPSVYKAGDTVFLDASATRDEVRGTVRFRWEQVAGVPVVIKPLNSEESRVAFVAPSTFNTVSNQGVGIRVTATDEQGWSVSRDLFVNTQSRRNSAIWR